MKRPLIKNRIVTFIDPESDRKWNVSLLIEGDKYGLDDCLTYGEKGWRRYAKGRRGWAEQEGEPCVEFYDAHNNKEETFGPRGQFVSRYYLSTLNGRRDPLEGINLCGHEPVWQVSDEFMAVVMPAINKIAWRILTRGKTSSNKLTAKS
tara:strand:- start:27 stop:473 length:447 start_codon:yes stop_codon:yes gene_type:complete